MEIYFSEDLDTSAKNYVRNPKEKVINVTPTHSSTDICSNGEDVKILTCHTEDHSCQHSPLIFSRCSSLGSFSDSELLSVHDDPSSNMSDTSYRTSEVVSPSELPDYPAQFNSSQTNKIQVSPMKKFNKECQKNLTTQVSELDIEQQLIRESCTSKKSIFEDDLSIYKEESTPIKLQSVSASSLSSLTIDDEDYGDIRDPEDQSEVLNKLITFVGNQNSNVNTTNDKCITTKNIQFIKKFEPFEDNTYFSADEEKILDECIRKGIKKVIGKNVDTASITNCEATTSGSSCYTDHINDTPLNTVNVIDEHMDDTCDLSIEEEILLDECIRRGIAKMTGQNIHNVKLQNLKVNQSKNLETQKVTEL